MAAKHIILLSDGTGNSSSSLFKTNVRRVYEALDLADPQKPKIPRQFAFYDDGVGTSSFRPLALLGGAIGFGLSRNVRDLYAFLCRTYDDGDRIYAFGFSRGAFTIRILISLIMNQGLVPYNGNEANLARDVNAAYREFRRNYRTKLCLEWPFRKIRDLFIGAKNRLLKQPAYCRDNNRGIGEDGIKIKIEFVGLWDTVDAYGLPVDEMTRAVDLFFVKLTMRDRILHPNVMCARHALALDDERNTFHPRLWDETAQDTQLRATHANLPVISLDDLRIGQVWFAGVHSDVGGGYADDSLAHVSLKWMMNEAVKRGIRFRNEIWDQFRALEDESGPIHDSRRGLAGYYRYNPRRIELLPELMGAGVTTDRIHESVLRRIMIGQDGYAPLAVPPDFHVVRINGKIMPFDKYLRVLAFENGCPPANIPTPIQREERREHAWNWVWWRRIDYFYTFIVTLLLILLPLVWKPDSTACESPFCFASGAINLLKVFLPAFAEDLIDTYTLAPGIFITLVVAVTAGIWIGRALERRVSDTMRPVWYAIPCLKPSSLKTAPAPVKPGRVNEQVELLRKSPRYQAFFRALRLAILPSIFAVLFLASGIFLVTKLSFTLGSSFGLICTGSAKQELRTVIESMEMEGTFHTNDLCAATGLKLEANRSYRITLTIPSGDPWMDAAIPAGPHGVDLPPKADLFAPIRRHIALEWYQPVARLGDTGSDYYPLVFKSLDGKPEAQDQQDRGGVFAADLTPRQTDELFLYVNDAVMPLGFPNIFYNNNDGSARVSVEPLPSSH
jgi:uncharacterized protein (DUF2235 family)